jgi:hypothetical protein
MSLLVETCLGGLCARARNTRLELAREGKESCAANRLGNDRRQESLVWMKYGALGLGVL